MSSDRVQQLLVARDRIVVMGVLNVTPDSFSDGGRYADLDAAVRHAEQMVADGADIIDVGGESTRPGAHRVAAEEESRRTVPVIQRLVERGILVSIDTYRASVAEQALTAGAVIVNDVSGGLGDEDMARVVSDAGCPWILMHWRGHSEKMASLAVYGDVVSDVRAELRGRIDDALAAGVRLRQLIIDPGIGFAKSAEHNWALLADFPALTSLGPPVLIAASRKSFLGTLLAERGGAVRPTDGREDATVALTTHAALAGAWGVRVHDVKRNVDAARVVAAIKAFQKPAPGEARMSVEAVQSDQIQLRGLTVRGHHGVFDFERRDGQDFVVDAALDVDTRTAAATDDLVETVHYGELAESLAAVIAGPPVNLLETLASRLADVCLAHPLVRAVTLTVHKPQAPIALQFSDVAVTIRREAEGRPA